MQYKRYLLFIGVSIVLGSNQQVDLLKPVNTSFNTLKAVQSALEISQH